MEKTLQGSGKQESYQLQLGASDRSVFIAHRDWIAAKRDQVKDIVAPQGNNSAYLDLSTIHNALDSGDGVLKDVNIPKLAKWCLTLQSSAKYRCFEKFAVSEERFQSALDSCLVDIENFRASHILVSVNRFLCYF